VSWKIWSGYHWQDMLWCCLLTKGSPVYKRVVHFSRCEHCNGKLGHTHTHNHLMALFPGLPGWAGTRKVKPIWILLKQETVSGSGISWAVCKSAPRSRHNHASTPPLSFYRPDALPVAQPTASKHWRQVVSLASWTNTKCNSSIGEDRYIHDSLGFIQHSLSSAFDVLESLWLAAFVEWLKLTHVGPGYYLDGWPSSGEYTISVCNKPTRSTQPCIPPGSLNRVPASAGVRAGMSPLLGGR